MPAKTIPPKVLEMVRVFGTLPDIAAVIEPVGEVVTGLSGRTLRRRLPRVRLSKKRFAYNVGDLRALLRGEIAT
jgi:hypothetical protein